MHVWCGVHRPYQWVDRFLCLFFGRFGMDFCEMMMGICFSCYGEMVGFFFSGGFLVVTFSLLLFGFADSIRIHLELFC